MAGELSLRVSLSFSKDGAEVRRSEGISVDVAGDAFIHNIQAIGTVEEELSQGSGTDLGTPGYILIINLDSTGYVEIGSTSTVYDIKILAGEFALYRHNSATIYAKSNSTLIIEYILFEA